MIASRPRRASAAEAASSKTVHQRALMSRCLALGQLAIDVAQGVYRAALFLGGRPQLARSLPEPGRAVGDDQRRRPEPATCQLAAEREPVLVALAAAQL